MLILFIGPPVIWTPMFGLVVFRDERFCRILDLWCLPAWTHARNHACATIRDRYGRDPCHRALIQTALTANARMGSKRSFVISSRTSSANSAVASPRGPNQPKKRQVTGAVSVPMSDSQMASGRTTRRLSKIIVRLTPVRWCSASGTSAKPSRRNAPPAQELTFARGEFVDKLAAPLEIEELSTGAVAAALGIGETNVKVRLHSARRSCR
jgi:hypothetical protein